MILIIIVIIKKKCINLELTNHLCKKKKKQNKNVSLCVFETNVIINYKFKNMYTLILTCIINNCTIQNLNIKFIPKYEGIFYFKLMGMLYHHLTHILNLIKLIYCQQTHITFTKC
jgi:hypothetical protein